MNNSYFAGLFEYDSTVNRQVLELLRNLPSVDEKTRKIFVHLISAKKVWIKRLNHENLSDIAIWPDLNWDECEALIEENSKAYRNYLADKSEEDLAESIHYQNSKGVEFVTPIRDILLHVLVHGGYHRGQIAKAVRESGGEPINTDYIMYVRNHGEKE